MKIIFQIDGGLGKSIAATAVCKAIKKQYSYDELIVISGYPEVFLCNTGIKVYHFNDMRYFYEQYIADGDYRIMAHNPYLETAYIKGDTHLIKVWCGTGTGGIMSISGITEQRQCAQAFLS